MTEAVKDRIQLIVNGQSFEGFESGTVSVTMESVTNSFSLAYVADGKNPSKRGIYPGDECELKLDAGAGYESLIKGYVDSTDDSDDAHSILLQCAGRSKGADLEDCSAITAPGSWKNATLSKICKDIAAPFDIKVTIDGDSGAPFANFSISKGESPLEAISRAATKRGLWVFSVSDGVVVAKAGLTSSGERLERGVNVIKSGRTDSWANRFSQYIYRGQVRGTDAKSGKAASQNKATIKDPTITRYRPLLLQTTGSAAELKDRAQVECNTRAGRGEVITATVNGWGTSAGKLWRANTTVGFKNDVLGIDATLLIVSADYQFAKDAPHETDLRMMRPEAFEIATFPQAKRGAKLK